MRLLILLFSAFVTAFSAGGSVARAADGAQIAASAAETVEAVVARPRVFHPFPADALRSPRREDVTLRTLAPLNPVPLYTGRRRL